MERKTALNTSIGAIILLSAMTIPGVSLLAGGIAGYLESKTPRTGASVGIAAGTVVLGFKLISSMFQEFQEALDHGIAHYLWVGLGYPASRGIVPFLLLPLISGAIGAYIRAETSVTPAVR